MSEKPGWIRRVFRFIGKVVSALRQVISLIIVIFFITVIAGMFADDIQPMPEKGALYLAPSGVLVDQRSYMDPIAEAFSQSNHQDAETLVRDVVTALDHAQYDPRITHILLDTDYLQGAGLAKLEEISSALMRFKKSGKPIIAIGDSFSQQQYFLAAHANEIILNPMGQVSLTGFGAYSSYYKEALDKLKINIHVFRVGKYKSAVEPFLGNSMSEAARSDRRELIDSLWTFYASKVEELRELPAGTIDNLVNNMHTLMVGAKGDSAALALEQGLVDRIATRSEMKNYLNQVLPTTNGEFESIPMAAYVNHIKLSALKSVEPNKEVIAVVVASGEILDGEQPEGLIGGDTLANIFADIRDDEQIKAVVLRIDSPGGSAFASDVIRDAIGAVRKRNIPVVVSMGSYAASGGYWIATEADRVFTLSTTITGSIGVFGIIPTFEESLNALGIYSDGVGTSDISGMMNLDRPMTKQTEIIIQSGVEHVYSSFLKLVADARNSTPDAVHEIAQGRVWTGSRAVELGLADQLGDLNDAISSAASMAGLSSYKLDYRRKALTFIEQIMMEVSGNIGASVRSLGLTSWLPATLQQRMAIVLEPLQTLERLNDPKGIYLYCDSCPR